jgi:SAM-dependent methyltransferase
VSDGDGTVRRQYEELPYPARDPADEAKRLVTGSPSHLLEIEHYIFAGHRAGPLRALIAGGGTGDGAVMLAQQLADRGEGEVTYLDISAAALAIARARAEARGLANIHFHQGSLLAIDMLELGRFDYIDCCGVLHHLADPREGVLALTEALSPDGGMGLMLYGELGRTGVYPLQRALRRLTGGEELPERLGIARRLLDGLPRSNWFRRNPFLGDHLAGDDAGLFDLLLHARDRAYTVGEIVQLCRQAGLRLTGLVPPLAYDPATFLADPELKARAARLPPLEAAALAEELAGSLKSHVFYVVRDGNESGGQARPAGHLVPSLRDGNGPELARALSRSPVLRLDQDGLALQFELPRAAGELLRLVDGGTSLDALYAALTARNPRLSRAAFDALFAEVYRVLNPLNMLLFGGPGAPARA